MAKRPEDRYASWEQFAQALLAVSQALPARKANEREGERFAQLRELAFFAEFPDTALWEALRMGEVRPHARGDVLMREGDPGDSFCVILEGRVALIRNGTRLFSLEPGVTLGEMAFLQPGNPVRSATAVAETEALVLVIENAALRRASEALQSRFDKAFIKLLVGRLISTTEQLGNWEFALSPEQDG
jgi:CRP-like cAMP-binding protein